MKQYSTHNHQSVWDLAVQLYGTVDAVGQLIEDNPQLSFGGEIPAGTVINVRPSAAVRQAQGGSSGNERVNEAVADYFERSGRISATGWTDPEASEETNFSEDFNNDFQ